MGLKECHKICRTLKLNDHHLAFGHELATDISFTCSFSGMLKPASFLRMVLCQSPLDTLGGMFFFQNYSKILVKPKRGPSGVIDS